MSSINECEKCDNHHVMSGGQRKSLESPTGFEPITSPELQDD